MQNCRIYVYNGQDADYSHIITNSELTASPQYHITCNPTAYFGLGFAVATQIKFATTYAVNMSQSFEFDKAYIAGENLFVMFGRFYPDTIERQGNIYYVTAYDQVTKFDTQYTGATDSTLKTSMISYCSDSNNLPDIVAGYLDMNEDMPLKIGLNSSQITGRDYIAAVAGAMCGYIESGGIATSVKLTRYDRLELNITQSHYYKCELSDMPCSAPKGIKIQTKNNGIQKIGSAPYVDMTNNFLFSYLDNTSPWADNIVNYLTEHYDNYYYGSVSTYTDEIDGWVVWPGYIIKVDNKPFYVMEKIRDENGFTFICKPTATDTINSTSSTLGSIVAAPVNQYTGYVTMDYLADASENKTIAGAVSVGDNLTAKEITIPLLWYPDGTQASQRENITLSELAKMVLADKVIPTYDSDIFTLGIALAGNYWRLPGTYPTNIYTVSVTSDGATAFSSRSDSGVYHIKSETTLRDDMPSATINVRTIQGNRLVAAYRLYVADKYITVNQTSEFARLFNVPIGIRYALRVSFQPGAGGIWPNTHGAAPDLVAYSNETDPNKLIECDNTYLYANVEKLYSFDGKSYTWIGTLRFKQLGYYVWKNTDTGAVTRYVCGAN